VRTDNRIKNLRVVSQSQNQWNINKSEAHGNPSLGVSFDGKNPRRKSKWFAYITRNKKRIGLGHFMTKEEAILAREKAENEFNARIAKHTPTPIEDHTPKVKS
jgi:hypothetical protein